MIRVLEGIMVHGCTVIGTIIVDNTCIAFFHMHDSSRLYRIRYTIYIVDFISRRDIRLDHEYLKFTMDKSMTLLAF